jgi:hypothetical protein
MKQNLEKSRGAMDYRSPAARSQPGCWNRKSTAIQILLVDEIVASLARAWARFTGFHGLATVATTALVRRQILLGVEKPGGFFNTTPGPRGPIRVDKPSRFFNGPHFWASIESEPLAGRKRTLLRTASASGAQLSTDNNTHIFTICQ